MSPRNHIGIESDGPTAVGRQGCLSLGQEIESVRGAPGIEMTHLDPEERPLCGLSKQEKLKKKKNQS